MASMEPKKPALSASSDRELTAFVREVVLPGGPDAVPALLAEHSRYALEHRASPIHRWGIFSLEAIPPRRRVIEYTGQKINRNEAFRRRWRQHVYLFRLNTRTLVDGAIGGSGAEYINHSCEPNLYTSVARGQIWYVSRRRIEPGEELTIDYRLRGIEYGIPCHCGAESCRGYLNYGLESGERVSGGGAGAAQSAI